VPQFSWFQGKPNDLERYIYMIGLSERNETLFYRTVMSDPTRFIPVLYHPTVAEVCLKRPGDIRGWIENQLYRPAY